MKKNRNRVVYINGVPYTPLELTSMRAARIRHEEQKKKAKRRTEILEKLRVSLLVILFLVLTIFVLCICIRLSWDSEFQKALGVNLLRVFALVLLGWAYINHELKAEAKAKYKKNSKTQRRRYVA